MTKDSKAKILKQLGRVENAIDLYLWGAVAIDELEKALRLVSKIKKRLES